MLVGLVQTCVPDPCASSSSSWHGCIVASLLPAGLLSGYLTCGCALITPPGARRRFLCTNPCDRRRARLRSNVGDSPCARTRDRHCAKHKCDGAAVSVPTQVPAAGCAQFCAGPGATVYARPILHEHHNATRSERCRVCAILRTMERGFSSVLLVPPSRLARALRMPSRALVLRLRRAPRPWRGASLRPGQCCCGRRK